MTFSLARVVTSVVLATGITALPSGSATALAAMFFAPDAAETVEPVVGEADFLIEAFPHTTADVQFSDTWGANRSGGRRHRGTDIMSPKGAEVVAVAAGTVTHMDWNRLSGWNIHIEHSEGWISAYVHLDNDTPGTDDGEGGPEKAFADGLEVGAIVEAGQVIGYVGDSGNAEGASPHTHFALKRDGEKVNPYPFLEAAWQRRLLYFAGAGSAT